MKTFSSEYLRDYSTYTFGYANYALYENGDTFHQIYDRGYLPYTGAIHLDYGLFYMARSLRVNLEKFTSSSENRRVGRKLEHLNLEISCIPRADFDFQDEHFRNLCLSYAKERFKSGSMSDERLDYVLSRPTCTHIFKCVLENEPIAYIVSCLDENILHYWYAFFDQKLMESYPIGKWLMWQCNVWAQENGRKFVYLGTSYGHASLYKIRDFKGLEWWNGAFWDGNVKLLKEKCKSDDEQLSTDNFKQLDSEQVSLFLNQVPSI